MEYSGCTLYYDSTAISRSDAKAAGAILEMVGYFNSAQSEFVDALFYKQKEKYVIAFGVNEEALSNRHIESDLKKALGELQKTYGTRRYQFRLLAMDSTGITDEKYIDPN